MSNFKNCIQPLFIPDTSPDKPGRPRFTLKPEGQSRMSRQEHHLSAANCATFVNAQRGREAQTPVLGEGQSYFRLVFRRAEPAQRHSRPRGVQMRSIYGTASEVPLVCMSHARLQPLAPTFRATSISRISSGVWPRYAAINPFSVSANEVGQHLHVSSSRTVPFVADPSG